MRIVNMSHEGKKHIELQFGRFFIAYNEFVSDFGFRHPPQTVSVRVLNVGKWAFGWW